MATRILFWFLLYPLSLLPLWVLYGISALFYLLLNHLVGYRKQVIIDNLHKSFPEKSYKEINAICKRYYWHVAQLAAEMLKMLTISKKKLLKRYFCTQIDAINNFYAQNKSVILMSSHYNNWEWMVLSLANQFQHHGIGVGKPNTNKTFELLINRARTRYGTEVIFANKARDTFEYYENQHIPVIYMMLSDQSPNDIHKSYKTKFLNQPSGMIYGAEYFAKKYRLPVFYYQIIKDKPGVYHIELELITENPEQTEYGYITEKYVQLLEATIKKQPEYWLWSHRRWKRIVTEQDIEDQKNMKENRIENERII